jgi:hypothetical protein
VLSEAGIANLTREEWLLVRIEKPEGESQPLCLFRLQASLIARQAFGELDINQLAG